jgi:hypothetical protein
MALWYIFFPFWYLVSRKIWQPRVCGCSAVRLLIFSFWWVSVAARRRVMWSKENKATRGHCGGGALKKDTLRQTKNGATAICLLTFCSTDVLF